VKRLILASFAVSAVGVALLALELDIVGERAFFAYTAGFAFAISTALGALVLLLIVNTGHVVWVVPLRRLLENVAATLPVFLVLFLPIVVGYRTLYPWARPGDFPSGQVHEQLVLAARWMNPRFFFARAYGHLCLWTFVSQVLLRDSVRQDETGGERLTERQRTFSAAMIPVVGLSLTFASFDWFMSLVPGWSSDLYGVYFFAGGLLASLGLLAVLTWAARRASLLPREVGTSHVSAIGRLLLTAVIFWTYIGVATVILIWVADLPREIPFLAQRVTGGWAVIAGTLVFGHFVVPFLALLPRELKRHAAPLAVLGAWLLVMHAVDSYWLVVPSSGLPPHALDIGGVLAVGGAAVAFGAWRASLASPYPLRDPNLSRSLRYESE
jgi:hypothetical protein